MATSVGHVMCCGFFGSGDALGDELVVDVGVDGLWSEAGEESSAVFLDAYVVLFVGADDELVVFDEVE